MLFSLLASYGEARGRKLPGKWFGAMLTPLGISGDAIRKSLQRMRREGSLVSERMGKDCVYALSPLGRASALTSTERLRRPPLRSWDGYWTLVVYRFDGVHRAERMRIRALLASGGFAALSRGVFVHPHDRLGAFRKEVGTASLGERMRVFRARSLDDEPSGAALRALWDLESLGARYSDFVRNYGPLLGRDWRRATGKEVLRTRLKVILDFLAATWLDPELPESMLPPDWPSREAWSIMNTLNRRLRGPYLRHGDNVMRSFGVTAEQVRTPRS